MLRSIFFVSLISFCLSGSSFSHAGLSVDFDDSSNWTRDPDVSRISSYADGHTYSDAGFTFTGGDTFRETTADHGGVAGALGTYAWRLRDHEPPVGGSTFLWRGIYASVQDSNGIVSGFSFDVRRFDNSTTPNFGVRYSTDGVNFVSVGTSIDNTFLDNSNAWKTYEVNFAAVTVGDGDFRFEIEASDTTERIMVDNFSLTAVPEPSSLTYGLIFALTMFGPRRRR